MSKRESNKRIRLRSNPNEEPKCFTCEQPGHHKFECSNKDQVREALNKARAATIEKIQDVKKEDKVHYSSSPLILDTGSEESLVKPDIATNIDPCSAIRVIGIGQDELIIDQKGVLPTLDNMPVYKNNRFPVEWIKGKRFIVCPNINRGVS